MNAYQKDQAIQLANRSQQLAEHDHAVAQKHREAGDLDQAIWWESLADKALNRAARLRQEVAESQSNSDENRSDTEESGG